MHSSLFTYLVAAFAASSTVLAVPASDGRVFARWNHASSPRYAYHPRWATIKVKRENNDQNRNNNGNNNNNNNNDQEIQFSQEEIQITQQRNGEEQVFQKKVTELQVQNDDTIFQKNVQRAEFFASNDRESNTVVQVVQTIVEVRQDGSRNNRYELSQFLADQGKAQTVTRRVTDAQILTVGECGNRISTATATQGLVQASDCAAIVAQQQSQLQALQQAQAQQQAEAQAQQQGQAEQLAQAQQQQQGQEVQNAANQSQLLPPGSAAPQAAEGVAVFQDPASGVQFANTNVC